MLNKTFEDLLFYPTSESLEEFPSPEELKMKILISTKPPKVFFESKDKDHELQKETEEEPWGEEVSDLKADHNAEYRVR